MSDDNSSDSDNIEKDKKKKVMEKLQAMGVMPGGDTIKEEQKPGKTGALKITMASVFALAIAGTFVWALNNDGKNKQGAVVSNADQHNPVNVSQAPYPAQWQNHQYQGGYESKQRQQQIHNQQEQYQKWLEQQRQAREKYYADLQKWGEQQRLAEQQRRLQMNKWLQQQQNWASQQQHYPYPSNMPNQGHSGLQSYGTVQRYQQPAPYYRGHY